MKVLLLVSFIAIWAIDYANADGAAIVAAARSQIGTPYSWGGGSYKGKSLGIDDKSDPKGAHDSQVVGFDCSGLAQYAVYKGTGKILLRTSSEQYTDPKCHHVPFDQHQPGDLVFFSTSGNIHHVAIISGPTTEIQAPQSGDHVRESAIQTTGRMPFVQRCF